jgi:cysteine desulfurase/selenocysteine lyase
MAEKRAQALHYFAEISTNRRILPMRFNLEKARQETPGCHNILHLNNAGASLMPQPVIDATIDHFQLEAQIGGYEAAARHHDKLEHVYDAAAQLISASRDEIACIENATRAWDMAFYSIPFQKGDRILTSMAEYASNYIAYLQITQRLGVSVEAIPDDEYGQISLDALRASIDERVKLISITHVPTSGGLVQPVVEVGKIARAANILYLVDACQSVGQMPVNVQQIGCDMLSTTGRKYLRGPRGTGFLYVRKEVLESLEPPFLDLHAATWIAKDRYEMQPNARRFENWETNFAGKIGLAAAIDYALEWDLNTIWRRVKGLAYQMRTQLTLLPGVIVRDRGINQGGIVTFTVEGVDHEQLKQQLAEQKINVSIAEVSSTRLDMEARHLTTMIRASVHYFNSEEEIEHFTTSLSALI